MEVSLSLAALPLAARPPPSLTPLHTIFPFPRSLRRPAFFSPSPPPLSPRSSLLPITCLPSIPETPLLPLSAKLLPLPLTLLFSLPLLADPQPFPVAPPLPLPRPRAHRTHLFRRVSAHQHSLSPSIRRGTGHCLRLGATPPTSGSRKGTFSRRPRPPLMTGGAAVPVHSGRSACGRRRTHAARSPPEFLLPA